ncbi:hypothetical protein DE146DRAFT_638025 [Phaeosphaeria sp. MPI-PUGE-AT-0046c]|nr:hypothetical protein DE146DRAFT_638025 [Phaeosphaeria sp. MPI-PUGE-AT-0046c]
MRFLCFHGRGTNVEAFRDQAMKLREVLSDDHEFVFLNGNLSAPPPEDSGKSPIPELQQLGLCPIGEG